MKNLKIIFLLLLVQFVLLTAAGNCAEPLPITILHWNDFHAQNMPFDRSSDSGKVAVGGAAYLAGLLDSLKGVEPRVIVLDAGDEFTGTPVSSITKGKSQFDVLNLIHPDAFEIGNHEFDVGWENLKSRIKEAKFSVLCSNVFDTSSNSSIASSSVIVTKDGVKVAVIGVIMGNLAGSVMGSALPGMRVDDPVKIVNLLLDGLEPQTDLQIALTHEGVEQDQRLAQGCPRLDLIVGGHQHVRLFDPVVENGVPILQAGSKGEYLGMFKALVDTSENRIVSYFEKLIPVIDSSIKTNPEVASLVEKQEKAIAGDMDQVVATLKEPWVRAYEGESNVGDWTADAMIKLTGKDISLINSGGFRRDLPAGPVTIRQIWELHPFGNRLVGFELSGEELLHAFGYQVRTKGDVVQVGGLRYRASSAGKVLELTIAGKPVDPQRRYTVISNEYVSGHMKKYFDLDLGKRPVTDLGWIDRDLVMEAMTQEGTVSSRIDGRIALVE
ncbi:MAG: bifunctional UDP-sugar hydrolase/5'-nucleotidase [bacterium]|nr:bifunctional UDP-sugar hydrolase/5'-nucleotidase [bacterium]